MYLQTLQGLGQPPNIRWVQDSLNRVLGSGLTVDGNAGPATRRAVSEFQRRFHLPAVTGNADDATIAALSRARNPRLRGSGISFEYQLIKIPFRRDYARFRAEAANALRTRLIFRSNAQHAERVIDRRRDLATLHAEYREAQEGNPIRLQAVLVRDPERYVLRIRFYKVDEINPPPHVVPGPPSSRDDPAQAAAARRTLLERFNRLVRPALLPEPTEERFAVAGPYLERLQAYIDSIERIILHNPASVHPPQMHPVTLVIHRDLLRPMGRLLNSPYPAAREGAGWALDTWNSSLNRDQRRAIRSPAADYRALIAEMRRHYQSEHDRLMR